MICSKCKQDFSEEDFIKDKAKKNGLSGYCKKCKRIIDAEYYATHPNRREQIKITRNKARLLTKHFIYNYLSVHPCSVCGFSDTRALEFHHRNPEEKETEIAKLRGCNLENIKKEIEKCDVLCANCHRILHAPVG